ncbi:MAG TPA: SGNH/GDSL hydrolase family protein [Terracidiphilus sp.]|nr:SGNH/GDSL hydrolase family protein [Terracidiphilus sp.]
MPRNKYLVVIFGLFMSQPFCSSCQNLALHDGDRVVFYGDSITAQQFYTRFVEDFVLTRYPEMRVTFVNAGVPGDTVWGGYTGDQATRLRRDVFPQHATVITIMLGMNDGYYVPFEQKYFDIFTKGYRALLAAMQSSDPAPRITLLTPTPYDEVTHGTEFAHYNEVISRHAAFVRELAASSHLPMSDFYEAIESLANAGAKKNSSLSALLIPDRIHPAEQAHWIMAARLARTWGLSPVVSRVSMDASKAVVLAAENTRVTAFESKQDGLSWTQADNALPLPLPLENEMMQFVLDISDLAAMDQQILQIANLSQARYVLKIDGKPIGSFSREQFAKGINLALYATPMEGQAKDVDGMENQRAQLDEAVFILNIDDPKSATDPAATKAIEAKNRNLLEQQRKACKPGPHTFEVLPE